MNASRGSFGSIGFGTGAGAGHPRRRCHGDVGRFDPILFGCYAAPVMGIYSEDSVIVVSGIPGAAQSIR